MLLTEACSPASRLQLLPGVSLGGCLAPGQTHKAGSTRLPRRHRLREAEGLETIFVIGGDICRKVKSTAGSGGPRSSCAVFSGYVTPLHGAPSEHMGQPLKGWTHVTTGSPAALPEGDT